MKSTQTYLIHLPYFPKPVQFQVVLQMTVTSSHTTTIKVSRSQCHVQLLATVIILHVLLYRLATTSSSGRLCFFKSHLHQFSRSSTIWRRTRWMIYLKYWPWMEENCINQWCRSKLKSRSLMRFSRNDHLPRKKLHRRPRK